MLTQIGRSQPGGGGCRTEFKRKSELLHGAFQRMFEVKQHFAFSHVRVGEHFLKIQDRPAGEFGSLEQRNPLGARFFAHLGFEKRHNFMAIGHPLGIGVIARIIDQFFQTQQFTEFGIHDFVCRRHLDVFMVFGLKSPCRNPVNMIQPPSLGGLSSGKVLHPHDGEQR